MAKPWDEAMKKVVAASPQTFVDWVFPGGRFIELVNTELPKKSEEPLRSDNCLAMELDGQPCIGHLEFQSTQDPEMALFLEAKLAGLLPLLPLVKGGANRTMAETMFSRMQSAKRNELIPIGTLLASLAFGLENAVEQNWLTRKVSEMYDILQETPVYQFMTKEAREEGLQEGLEKGRQEERQEEREALRQMIVNIVRKRFPKTVRLAKKQVAVVDDLAVLRQLVVDISVAQTAAELTQYLLAVDEEADE